jgi:serine/threonine protein phosphatase PrpC
MGSCALLVLVRNNKVYSANIGDSKGVIVSYDSGSNQMTARKINNI